MEPGDALQIFLGVDGMVQDSCELDEYFVHRLNTIIQLTTYLLVPIDTASKAAQHERQPEAVMKQNVRTSQILRRQLPRSLVVFLASRMPRLCTRTTLE